MGVRMQYSPTNVKKNTGHGPKVPTRVQPIRVPAIFVASLVLLLVVRKSHGRRGLTNNKAIELYPKISKSHLEFEKLGGTSLVYTTSKFYR